MLPMPTSTSWQRSVVTVAPSGSCSRARSRALLRFQIEEAVMLPARAGALSNGRPTAPRLASRSRRGRETGKVDPLRRHP